LTIDLGDPLNRVDGDRRAIDRLDEVQHLLRGVKGVDDDAKHPVLADHIGCCEELLGDIDEVSDEPVVPVDLRLLDLLEGSEETCGE
jgi:hypothetical protein